MKKILTFILAATIYAVIVVALNYLLFNYKLEFFFSGAFNGIIAMGLAIYFYHKTNDKQIKNLFKRLAIWVRYKKVDKYYFKATSYTCLEECPIYTGTKIGSISCQSCKNCIDKNAEEDRIWIKCKYIRKKHSFNLLKWLKKLLFICIIALLFSSCSMYINCNIEKNNKQYPVIQDSIQGEKYLFDF